jgi:hypothetical protein
MLLSIVQWQRMHRVYSDLDAMPVWIYSYWNYRATNVAPTLKINPSPRRRRDPISKHVHVWERIKILIMDFEETEARNDRAGKCQQQFNRPTQHIHQSSRQRGRPTWTKPQLSECNKYPVLGPRWGLTPCLTGRLTVGRNVTLILT